LGKRKEIVHGKPPKLFACTIEVRFILASTHIFIL
jgi:hypothetical protein